jgi:hypothetical protein
VPVTQTVVVTDNQKPTASNLTQIFKGISNYSQTLHVVIGEADNCTANPVVAWVSDFYRLLSGNSY